MRIKSNSVWIDLILTFITFGIWNLWVQIRQISDANKVLNNDHYSIWKVLFLCLITFGLYFPYHEFKLTNELHLRAYQEENMTLAILAGIASCLGLWFVVDSYQQSLLNIISERPEVL